MPCPAPSACPLAGPPCPAVFRNETMDATHLCEFHQVEVRHPDTPNQHNALIHITQADVLHLGARVAHRVWSSTTTSPSATW